MSIGRPTEFDRDEALEKAMDLFWRNGYEATGLAELTSEMGIGRQSLYNAFGDKRSLFLEAIKYYFDRNTQSLIGILQAPGSPVGNIRNVLETVASGVAGGDCRGCLLTNSIVEMAPHDDEVANIMRSTVQRMEKEFRKTLDRAIDAGEISGTTDTRGVARFLNNTLHGMVVMGKASTSKAALNDIVKIALSKI